MQYTQAHSAYRSCCHGNGHLNDDFKSLRSILIASYVILNLIVVYCIARNIGRVLNLAVWRFLENLLLYSTVLIRITVPENHTPNAGNRTHTYVLCQIQHSFVLY